MISIFFISKGIRSLDILSIGYYDRSYFFFVIKSHRLFYMKEQLINNNTYIYMAYITYTVRKIKIIKTMIIKKKPSHKTRQNCYNKRDKYYYYLLFLELSEKTIHLTCKNYRVCFFFVCLLKNFITLKVWLHTIPFFFFFFWNPYQKLNVSFMMMKEGNAKESAKTQKNKK